MCSRKPFPLGNGSSNIYKRIQQLIIMLLLSPPKIYYKDETINNLNDMIFNIINNGWVLKLKHIDRTTTSHIHIYDRNGNVKFRNVINTDMVTTADGVLHELKKKKRKMNNKLYTYKLKQQLILLFNTSLHSLPLKRVNRVEYDNKIDNIINNVMNNSRRLIYDKQ